MLWAESDRDSCNESASLGRVRKPASVKCTTQEQVPQSWRGHRGFQERNPRVLWLHKRFMKTM